MTKKIIAVLLVFCLCASLVPMVSAEEPTLQNSVDLDQLVEHGIALCRALESGGSYDSVVNTSLGCVALASAVAVAARSAILASSCSLSVGSS